MLVVGLFEPGCPKRSGMYLKSQNEAAVENGMQTLNPSSYVRTKEIMIKKWYSTKLQGKINSLVCLGGVGLGVYLKSLTKAVWFCLGFY